VPLRKPARVLWPSVMEPGVGTRHRVEQIMRCMRPSVMHRIRRRTERGRGVIVGGEFERRARSSLNGKRRCVRIEGSGLESSWTICGPPAHRCLRRRARLRYGTQSGSQPERMPSRLSARPGEAQGCCSAQETRTDAIAFRASRTCVGRQERPAAPMRVAAPARYDNLRLSSRSALPAKILRRSASAISRRLITSIVGAIGPSGVSVAKTTCSAPKNSSPQRTA
jgi:hypothetical protein